MNGTLSFNTWMGVIYDFKGFSARFAGFVRLWGPFRYFQNK